MSRSISENKRKVILTPPHPFLVRRVLASRECKNVKQWIYLGDDPGAAKRFEGLFGPRIPRLEIARDLQMVARRYRQAYIDYIGMLSEAPCSLPWLLTSLSEKNLFASSFFLSFCSVVVCLEELAENEDTLFVICGSRGILETLRMNLTGREGLEILCFAGFPPPALEDFRLWIQGGVHRAWFTIRYTCRILLAIPFHTRIPSIKGDPRSPPPVFIHTWTDERSFPKGMAFRDIFYGDLAAIIGKVARPWYVIDILPTLNFGRALLSLRNQSGLAFILQEQLLRLGDIPRALVRARRRYSRGRGYAPIEGIRVEPLIREEQQRDLAKARAEQSYLYYRAGIRLAAISPGATYVYTFENQMWEKCTLAGLRSVDPGFRAIGYAHAIVNPMNLTYTYSRLERGCTELPSNILTNGEYPRRVLVEAGFPEDSIHVSGALRYKGLVSPQLSQHVAPGGAVLIAGSVSITRTIELLTYAITALGNDPSLAVWIKCHPNLPFRYIRRKVPAVPAHILVRTEPVEELLSSTSVVLYTESTVAVEAAARGLPVIHVKSGSTIDVNIFESLGSVPSVGSAQELRSAVRRALDHPKDQEPVREYIRGLFAPVNPEIIRLVIASPRTGSGSARDPP